MELPFATLTPVNVVAKMAFSDVYDNIVRGRQSVAPPDTMAAHNLRVEPEQKYNKDVLRFRREIEHKLSGRGASESPTEPDTDAEVEAQHVGMVWTGHYDLRLQTPPLSSEMGWVAGKGPMGKGPHPDIIFCTRAFAKRLGLSLRSFHAGFNFDPQNGAFFVASITRSCLAGLTVNGETVTREMRALNQHSMRIRVDSLEYIFQYTDFASSKGFTKMREEYMTTMAGAPSFVVFDMPTPRRTTATIGRWTLSDPLGSGGAGRVFLGSNSKNEVVAIKIMECTPGAASCVDTEIARCRDLTLLARSRNDGGRIVRLKEIIDPRNASTTKCAFEDVALVLEPMTPLILSDWVGNRSRGVSRLVSQYGKGTLPRGSLPQVSSCCKEIHGRGKMSAHPADVRASRESARYLG